MRTRIVTYDVRDERSYEAFYEFLEQYGGIELTQSTYAFDTDLSQAQFETKLKSIFHREDTVYYISYNNDERRIFYKQVY